MTSRVLLRRTAVLLALPFVAACKDDNEPTGPGSFTLTGPTAGMTIAAGASAQTTVSVTRSGGQGPVTLTAEDLPAGVSVTPNPAQAGTGTTTLTVAVAPNTPAGAKTFTIRGHVPGLADQTATVNLTTTATSQFRITAPATAAIVPGRTTTITTSIANLGGFNRPVTFTVEGLPAGVTAAPVTVTGNTATITLTATTAAAFATVPISLVAHSAGYFDQTASLNLTVRPAVTFTFAPNPVLLGQTLSANVTVTLDRAPGFVDPVTVTLEGLPAGVTATTATTTTSTATVTLSADATAIQRAANLTLRVASPSLADQTATLPIRVFVPLSSGVGFGPTAGAVNTSRYYRIVVPAGKTSLVVQTTGATSDIDIYVRRGGIPVGSTAGGDVCAAETGSGNETCTIANPAAGDYYVLVFGYEAYSGVTVTATTTP